MDCSIFLYIIKFYLLICNVNSMPINKGRLTLSDEWSTYNVRNSDGPGTYAFGYDVDDAATGNVQFRSEEKRANGSVTGSYGFVTADGHVHVVRYIADRFGYRAETEDNAIDDYLPVDSHEASSDIKPDLQSISLINQYQLLEDQHIRPIDRFEQLN